ncbi:MAG: hypothetical protein U0470_04905 [Anaerolineae bacterium]
MRTFTLLGGVAALAGSLALDGQPSVAAVVLGGAMALVVVAYAVAGRTDVDATTEVAALVVLAAGFVAGLGHLALASGIIAVTSVILLEKTRLHALVERLDDTELRAAARFGVMAVVVLPLLPEGPFGPFGGIRPARCGRWCCSSPASASPATSPAASSAHATAMSSPDCWAA